MTCKRLVERVSKGEFDRVETRIEGFGQRNVPKVVRNVLDWLPGRILVALESNRRNRCAQGIDEIFPHYSFPKLAVRALYEVTLIKIFYRGIPRDPTSC